MFESKIQSTLRELAKAQGAYCILPKEKEFVCDLFVILKKGDNLFVCPTWQKYPFTFREIRKEGELLVFDRTDLLCGEVSLLTEEKDFLSDLERLQCRVKIYNQKNNPHAGKIHGIYCVKTTSVHFEPDQI